MPQNIKAVLKVRKQVLSALGMILSSSCTHCRSMSILCRTCPDKEIFCFDLKVGALVKHFRENLDNTPASGPQHAEVGVQTGECQQFGSLNR